MAALTQRIYTISSYDALGFANVITDAFGVIYTTTANGGFKDMQFFVPRPAGRLYLDLNINYTVKCKDWQGFVVWQGVIVSLVKKQDFSSGLSTNAQNQQNCIEVDCLGDAKILTDQQEVLANDPALYDISTYVSNNISALITSGYLKAAYITTTGVTIHYSNGVTLLQNNRGTIKDLLNKLLPYGDSNNNFYSWAIWQDRTFYWLPRPKTYTLRSYINGAERIQLEHSTTNDYGSIAITYIDLNLAQQIYSQASTVSSYLNATRYDLPPGTSQVVIPITQVRGLDITGHGPITITQVTALATTILKQTARPRIKSGQGVYKINGNIVDEQTGNFIPLGRVRAGNIMLVPDITQRDWSSQAWLGPEGLTGQFYVQETSYDVDNQELTIKPEDTVDYSILLEKLMAQDYNLTIDIK